MTFPPLIPPAPVAGLPPVRGADFPLPPGDLHVQAEGGAEVGRPNNFPQCGAPGNPATAYELAHESEGESLTTRATTAQLSQAQTLANLCAEFKRLLDSGQHSLNTAARAVGKSPSWFSGRESLYRRWLASGVAGLLPAPRPGAGPGEVAQMIASLPWFVPAAKFFHGNTNRTWSDGSVPEAILRTISLPHLPVGWTAAIRRRFLLTIGLEKPPECPPALREAILARQKAGQPLVTELVHRAVRSGQAVIRQHRNPKEAALDLLNSPGGMRLFHIPGETARLARAGEIIEADDATVNFPVCVPWTRDGSDDPCVQKYGVKVARFQWLVTIDAGTGYVPAYTYTARPRSSYRAEDILTLMRGYTREWGVPASWRFERGSWEASRVQEAIRLMGSRCETVYSPHQKPFIEGLFNHLWTKLSVHFPGGHVGRFRGEEKEACDLLTACQRGHRDPRKYFPMLDTAIAAFDEVIAEKNRTPVTTAGHGRWIPEERWERELQIRALDPASEWLFSPFAPIWTVKGMLVGGQVPIMGDVSVPFDFSAPFLTQYHGQKVQAYFDPADAKCRAMLTLVTAARGHKTGEVLGYADQINEHAGYARLVMGWGDDAAGAGVRARRAAAAALRREVRAIRPRGQTGATTTETRDGQGGKLADETVIELPALTAEAAQTAAADLAARTAAAEEFIRSHALDFA